MRLLLLSVALAGNQIHRNTAEMLLADYKVILAAMGRGWQLAITEEVSRREVGVGDMEIEDIKMCTHLRLSGMGLVSLPAYGMAQMASLEVLILDNNEDLEITEDDIKKIRHLPIRQVSIRSSDIGGVTLRNILQLPNLTSLDISNNLRIGKDHNSFGGFGNMKLLERLIASNVNLSVKSFNRICRCRNLRELNVSVNRGLGRAKLKFGRCKNSLVILNVKDTDLSEASLRSICRLTRMALLDISLNTRLGPVLSSEDFSFGNLEKTLIELNVRSVGITSSNIFRTISGCERLAMLYAYSNPGLWRGADEIDFGYLKARLLLLNIGKTNLSPAVLSRILEFEQLLALDISNNGTVCQDLDISNLILGGIKDSLINISARNTGLTGEGLRWTLSTFKGLKRVDVTENPEITSDDLINLDFEALKYGLAEFSVTTDSETMAALQRMFPATNAVPYSLSEVL